MKKIPTPITDAVEYNGRVNSAVTKDAERYQHILKFGIPHQGSNSFWYLDGRRFSTAEDAIDAAIATTKEQRK